MRALVLLSRQQHFAVGGIHRKLRHAAPQASELAPVVQRAQGVDEFQGLDERFRGRRVHEVEVDQVVDPKRLETQHHVRKVGPLDLGVVDVVHLLLVRELGVQPEAVARAHAPGPAAALVGGGLGARHRHERLHASFGTETVQLAEPAVDDVDYLVQRDRGLGDVGRQNGLPRVGRRGLENLRLHIAGQRGVDGQHDELPHVLPAVAQPVLQLLLDLLDLLLPREKHQNISQRLSHVDLEHSYDRGVQKVGLGRLGVVYLDGVPPARNPEDRRMVEVQRKLFCLQRGGSNDQPKVLSVPAQVLRQPEDDIRVHRALVRLVNHQNRVAGQVRLCHHFPEQHAIRHVLQHGVAARAILEPNSVPDLLPELASDLLGHPRGHRHGRHPSGLRAPDFAGLAVSHLVQILRYLRRLATAGLAHHHQNGVVAHRREQFVPVAVDGQAAPLLEQLAMLLSLLATLLRQDPIGESLAFLGGRRGVRHVPIGVREIPLVRLHSGVENRGHRVCPDGFCVELRRGLTGLALAAHEVYRAVQADDPRYHCRRVH
ncbi:uncharacterized protein BcabD6B2_20170 [Babesia caballi]|uniref:Uncharacterized protein n=1 Tax=Babesia caballi TaxID=5871 RepID=A0AAV4LS26_BABCB|nr:hypothetical protein BcabD6B2_20170 [Babesia caballi]